MIKDQQEYVRTIAKAISRIEEATAKISKEEFENDWMAQDAIAKELEEIVEAAGKLSDELRANYPNISWKAIIGMRHILIHDYSNADLDIVWDTAIKGIPEFKAAFTELPDSRELKPAA